MLKEDFICELRARLSGLPRGDAEERLAFYSEMIDERIEEGCEEEQAVSEMGSVEALSEQILSEIPLKKLVKERITPRRALSASEKALLWIGSPLWVSLALAALCVIMALYAVIWSLFISVMAIFVAFVGCALGCTFGGAVVAIIGSTLTGIAGVGVGIVFSGLSIFMLFASKWALKGAVSLTGSLALLIKKCFIKKEETV